MACSNNEPNIVKGIWIKLIFCFSCCGVVVTGEGQRCSHVRGHWCVWAEAFCTCGMWPSYAESFCVYLTCAEVCNYMYFCLCSVKRAVCRTFWRPKHLHCHRLIDLFPNTAARELRRKLRFHKKIISFFSAIYNANHFPHHFYLCMFLELHTWAHLFLTHINCIYSTVWAHLFSVLFSFASFQSFHFFQSFSPHSRHVN